MSENSQESGGEEYEIDRIIGRRISIAKTEYLVFWKGYTIEDCTWEPLVLGASCDKAIRDFEAKCTKLRFKHARNPRAWQVDKYENEGIAALLEDAAEYFADGSRIFQNVVGSSDFAAGSANSAAAPTPVVATVGWNRAIGHTDTTRALNAAGGSSQVSSIQRPVISEIFGTIKAPSGYRCYLTQWSDNELSWERPEAFDEAMDVLQRYEGGRDASDRSSLLMELRQANEAGTLGPVRTSAKKTDLERTASHSSLGSNSRTDESANVSRSVSDSPASQPPPMFDLSTSFLLKAKPTADASAAPASSNLSEDGGAFGAPTLPVPNPEPANPLANRGNPRSKLVIADSSDEDIEFEEEEVLLSGRVENWTPVSNAQAPADAPRSANTGQRSVGVVSDQSHHLPFAVIGAVRSSAPTKRRHEKEIRLANVTVANADMYTDYKKLHIAWTNLDLDQATWEPVPNPIVDPEGYGRLYPLFKAWETSEKISLREHQRLVPTASTTTVFSPFERQPEYLQAGKMYGYQIEGLNWLLCQRNRKMAAILADDPGLGKTIQTVAFLSVIYYSTVPDGLRNSDAAISNHGTSPFLVVVPTSLVDNWLAEFRKWAPFLTVATLSERAVKRKIELKSTIFRKDSCGNLDLRCHVLVTSYKALCQPREQQQFGKAGITWEAAVFDEGHQLKNDQTITYKALDKIKARQRIIVTGTPLPNNIDELFSLLSFVMPDERESLGQLKAQFETDSGIVDQVRGKLRPYMLRLSKTDVQLTIPPKYEYKS